MSIEYRLGFECLGPIFRFWCYRLRLIELYKSATPLLFLSRGGLRLHYLYGLYLQANKLADIAPRRDFYISRIAGLTALLSQHSTYAAEQIAIEYGPQPIETAMSYFLPPEVFEHFRSAYTSGEVSGERPFTAEFLLSLLKDSGVHADVFRQHVHLQRELLSQYLDGLCGRGNEVILVDTGWSGSIVYSLQQLFPEIAFTAVFFGRFNYGRPPPPWFDAISGLVMQHEHYNPAVPQSAIVFHRHLIESLCEPSWPSVRYYVPGTDSVVPAGGFMPEALKAPGNDEAMARGVRDFIERSPADRPEKVVGEYQFAVSHLARLLTRPNRKEALALGMPPRSMDFGRELKMPVLLPVSAGPTRLNRLRRSLWRQGQIALEFDSLRLFLQLVFSLGHTRLDVFQQFRRMLRDWQSKSSVENVS